MRKVELLVELPEGMSLVSLRELLDLNGVTVQAVRESPNGAPCWRPHLACVHITPVELAVLKAFTYCNSNEEIAEALSLSPETVKTHVKNLYRKLRVGSRAYAVGRALRLGLLTLQDLTPPPNGGDNPPDGG